MTTISQPTEPRRRTPVWAFQPWSELASWDPQLQDLISHVLPTGGDSGDFVPGGQLYETDDSFTLDLDVPGVDRKDISIDISGRRVHVTGTKAATVREGVLRRSTRPAGSFTYEAVLPVPVDAAGATATLTDGVMILTLPKAAEAKATRVEIR